MFVPHIRGARLLGPGLCTLAACIVWAAPPTPGSRGSAPRGASATVTTTRISTGAGAAFRGGGSDTVRGGSFRSDRPGAEGGLPASRALPGGRLLPPAPMMAASSQVVMPRAMAVCTTRPDDRYWGSRDLFTELQWASRRGALPVVKVPEDAGSIQGVTWVPSGWRAYGIPVPPGEKVHVRLKHPMEGWFRLQMVNQWGTLEQGMLQNLLNSGNPEVSYTNLFKAPRAVYIIVDDPAWISTKDQPFELVITRSWDPSQKPSDQVSVFKGVWAKASEPEAPGVAEGFEATRPALAQAPTAD